MLNTKKKILNAALTEFAELGYRRSTVRNICDRANVNVAAINYHFSCKRELYRQVFEEFFPKNPANKLPDGAKADTRAGFEMALRKWIHGFLTRSLNAGHAQMQLLVRISMHEFVYPSEVRDDLFSTYMLPELCSLKSILARVLDEGSDLKLIHLKMFSIVGQCTFYFYHSYLVERLSGDMAFLKKNFEEVTDLIFNQVAYDLDLSKLK